MTEFNVQQHMDVSANVIAQLISPILEQSEPEGDFDYEICLDDWFVDIKPLIEQRLKDEYGEDLRFLED